MKEYIQLEKKKPSETQNFGFVVIVGIVTTFLTLGLYGYLGSFSRYGSDDYCLSAFFLRDGNLFSRMVERYINDSSRYTNILFIGLVDEILGWYNVAILPGSMLALFTLGFYLLLNEIVQFVPMRWSRGLSLYCAGLIVFFTVLQAPNLYETLYWRAGMTSHFAPLVFLPFLGVFLLREIRITKESVHLLWVRIVGFLSAFVLGGFSEPPTAMLITILAVAIMTGWWRGDFRTRQSTLILLTWTLAGALLALMTLALAPANSLRLGNSQPGLYELASKTMSYPLLFILDEFHKYPLPTIITMLLPGLLFYLEYVHLSQTLSREARVRLGFLLPAIIILGYVLIAATFAPSVYGQNYPVARARFAGRLILTCALMINGAVLGILLTALRTIFLSSSLMHGITILGLLLLSLYPLRAASRLFVEIPEYKQRAIMWDQRDANMRAMEKEGIRNLIVPFLPREITQDLGDRSTFRLNRCASLLYGVDSIVAGGTDHE